MTTASQSPRSINHEQVQQRYLEQLATRQAITDRVTRSPATLARALDPEYRIRPHIRTIADAFLELRDHDQGREGYDRILLTTPPQIGKSVTAGVWAPLWWLIQHPRHRIVVSSYSGLLATKRGRAIRDLVETHGKHFGIQLAKAPRAADDWSLTTGGGCRSVGVGGGLTGHSADCVTGDSEVVTSAGRVSVAELCGWSELPAVLSWNHESGRAEYRQVQATRVVEDRPVVEVATSVGRGLRCTPDHLVYVPGRGYVAAGDLRLGDRLLAHDSAGDSVAEVWRGPRERVYDLQVSGNRNFFVGGLLVHNCLICDDPIQDREQAESLLQRDKVEDWWSSVAMTRLSPGAPVVLILTRWHCLTHDQLVSTVQGPVPVQDVQAGDTVLTSSGYQEVQATASRVHRGDTVRIRAYGAPDDLHVTPEHRIWTQEGWKQAGDVGNGDWLFLPALPGSGALSGEELESLVPAPTPSRRTSTDGMWTRVRTVVREGYDGPVYDLQTPAGDFVASGSLVHNCDDLAGRLLDREGSVEEGGRWKVVHLPAMSDLQLTNGADALGRGEGEPLTHPKIKSADVAALRRHWDDKRASVSMRDWHALFQGDPKPTEGALVTEALLRARRFVPVPDGVERQRFGVAVDPSGGGRDLAGIVGGFLATDGRLYVTHDVSRTGYSTTWAMEAALLASEQEADFVVFEQSGLLDKPNIRRAFDSAWDTVQRVQAGMDADEFIDPDAVRRARALGAVPDKPLIKMAQAKKGKLLRAEPVAQQWYDDRMRTGAYLPELEGEWVSWMPSDSDSPGRIDASVYLAHVLLTIPGSEAVISVSSQVSRDEVLYESQRREMSQRAAQPQMGQRIERRPFRPGM